MCDCIFSVSVGGDMFRLFLRCHLGLVLSLPLSHSHCSFICILRSLPIMGHHTGVRVLGGSLSLHHLFILVCFYYPMLGAGVKRLLMLFSEGVVPYVALYLLCPWDNVSSGSSHATIL